MNAAADHRTTGGATDPVRPSPASDNGRRGFSLVELLVVIAILSLLTGILLPVLSSAQRNAKQMKEMSAGRQLQLAHIHYAQANDDALLPGFTRPGVEARDIFGNQLSPPMNQRYPWRIAPYLEEQLIGAILVNQQEAVMEDRQAGSDDPALTYTISVNPSFGYNYHYVGGDLTLSNRSEFADLYLERASQAFRPSALFVFGSAHVKFGSFEEPGFHRIDAPTGSPNNPQGWSTAYDLDEPSPMHGNVHVRSHGRAIMTFLDGHVAALRPEALRDMQRWSDRAARAGDPQWSPREP